MKKRSIALLMAGAAVLTAFLMGGCTRKTEEAKQGDGKEAIQFWYHDGNPTSNKIFEELIRRFEEKNPEYKVGYVGLPADSYLQKYNTAVAANMVPDVASIRDQDVSTLLHQGALLCLEESFGMFREKDHINSNVLESIRNCVAEHRLYCLPQYISPDIYWYNTKRLEEGGMKIPETMDQFIKDCESYSNSAEGEYFYSLRGGAGSLDNMFDFIFTYADVYELFDGEGNCTLSDPRFVEALSAYASIYWNGWVSKDSVSNGFKEMVAEFGSGKSLCVAHNSSSLSEHKTNLGEGIFVNAIAPANDSGIVVTKDVPFMGYAIFDKAPNKEGAVRFLEYLTSSEAASYLCEAEGRVPVNDLIYEEEWYQQDPYIKTYQELTGSDHVKFLPRPLWLPQWNEFLSKIQEPDLQAVLLKEKTPEEALLRWAGYLTQAQKEYLSAN